MRRPPVRLGSRAAPPSSRMAPTSRTWIPTWVSPLSGSHHSVEPPGRATTAAVDTSLQPCHKVILDLDGGAWRVPDGIFSVLYGGRMAASVCAAWSSSAVLPAWCQ
jgi:hypothetical protein